MTVRCWGCADVLPLTEDWTNGSCSSSLTGAPDGNAQVGTLGMSDALSEPDLTSYGRYVNSLSAGGGWSEGVRACGRATSLDDWL